jgi:hypothetical protein
MSSTGHIPRAAVDIRDVTFPHRRPELIALLAIRRGTAVPISSLVDKQGVDVLGPENAEALSRYAFTTIQVSEGDEREVYLVDLEDGRTAVIADGSTPGTFVFCDYL